MLAGWDTHLLTNIQGETQILQCVDHFWKEVVEQNFTPFSDNLVFQIAVKKKFLKKLCSLLHWIQNH